jgi:SpoVK/Ycf46/Vps4 family AAA+-type ATPase
MTQLIRSRSQLEANTDPNSAANAVAANVMANELKHQLCRIDLSDVVSKHIGETEKNLSRVIDAAETGDAVLFFEETEARFEKRTAVKNSHEGFANIEINHLLELIEHYRGVAILSTNTKSIFDQAFLQGTRHMVEFPDSEER